MLRPDVYHSRATVQVADAGGKLVVPGEDEKFGIVLAWTVTIFYLIVGFVAGCVIFGPCVVLQLGEQLRR